VTCAVAGMSNAVLGDLVSVTFIAGSSLSATLAAESVSWSAGADGKLDEGEEAVDESEVAACA